MAVSDRSTTLWAVFRLQAADDSIHQITREALRCSRTLASMIDDSSDCTEGITVPVLRIPDARSLGLICEYMERLARRSGTGSDVVITIKSGELAPKYPLPIHLDPADVEFIRQYSVIEREDLPPGWDSTKTFELRDIAQFLDIPELVDLIDANTARYIIDLARSGPAASGTLQPIVDAYYGRF